MSVPTQRLRELPVPGQRLADYVIERELGRGGMGRVYVAREERLDRRVALKVLAPEVASDPVFRERFVRESRLAAGIQHPHVVPIYRAGDEDGALFIAMHLVQGSLKDELRAHGPPDVTRVLATIDQIGGALDAAHRAGLVHRDVKPANILVERSEVHGVSHCYLTDFGISKTIGSEHGLTGTGQALGSPSYMAPEQIEGRPVDGRTDVYGLGCVLFELLTGRVPFPRETPEATCWAHVNEPPPSARALRPQLPVAIDGVIATALAKSPSGRYQDCRSLAIAAREAMLGPPSPTGARTSPEARQAARVPHPAPSHARNGAGAPPRPPIPPRQQRAAGPPPKRKRNWVVPVLIVLGALLLAGGGIAAALLLSGDDGPSQEELDEAKRIIARTERVNRHLKDIADDAKAAEQAKEAELLAQQREAAALREAAARDLDGDRELRESLVDANEQLEQAARELRRVAGGRESALGPARDLLGTAEQNLGDAKDRFNHLDEASNDDKPGPKVTPKVTAASLSLPRDASTRIVAGRGARIDSLATAGDVDGDGTGDLALTVASWEQHDGFAVFGGAGRSVKLRSLGSDGIAFLDSKAYGGVGAGQAGDLDGDGTAELALPGAEVDATGAQSEAIFLASGTRSTGQVDVTDESSLLGSLAVPAPSEGPCQTESVPTSTRAAGDVNNDGNDDLLVTSPCSGDAGLAWVVFGPVESSVSLDSLTGDDGFTISGGTSTGPGLGTGAAAGRDVDADGYDDIVLGHPNRDGRATAYVIYGSDSSDDVDVEALGDRGYALTSSTSEGAAGSSVALLEDLNGDGRAEVVVGAPEESTSGGAGSGAAYVVFGQDAGRDVELSDLRGGGFAITGPAPARGADVSGLGWSAAAAGDVNGDGKEDIVLGAPGLSGGGIAYVVYGKSSTEPVRLKKPGTQATRIDYADRADEVHVTGGSDLDGDGRDDVVIAPTWDDGTELSRGGDAFVVGVKP